MNSQSGASSSSCANSRTSLKTMVVVVVVIVAVALIGRFGSSSLSEQSFTDTTGGSSGTPQNKEEEAPASQAVRPIDCTFINNIASQIERTKAEITTFWNVSHYPNFMSTMNIPTESWKIQKAKYVKLLLEANTNFVDRAEGSPGRFNATFVAGFSGSSVTAGHGTGYTFITSRLTLFLHNAEATTKPLLYLHPTTQPLQTTTSTRPSRRSSRTPFLLCSAPCRCRSPCATTRWATTPATPTTPASPPTWGRTWIC